jgi:hypothetical protein
MRQLILGNGGFSQLRDFGSRTGFAPLMLARTGLSVGEHQARTAACNLDLMALVTRLPRLGACGTRVCTQARAGLGPGRPT